MASAHIFPKQAIALHFRDELRAARAVALDNAEDFAEILFVIERFGVQLTNSVDGLNAYSDKITQIANESPLAIGCDELPPTWQIDFRRLYEVVKDARNDALHTGAYARHLTSCSIDLALVLEDALMSNSTLVRDFMVKNPLISFEWQPLAIIRQSMLANSFSYLPYHDSAAGDWIWISDFELARCLRSATSKTKRKELLALPLEVAVKGGKIKALKAEICHPDDSVSTALDRSNGSPILVLENDTKNGVAGILTPFDIL
ncbi:MAG: hypothetical protein M3Y72_01800 [Acidobacteriota bacterium]|nr:hypothetical protein [Acidobacteriota bacterium]